jgi:Tfp pilus assembly protein FimV
LVLLVVAVLALAALASRPTSVDPDRTTTIRVRTGESLWSVARSHPVEGLSTAQTVQLIVELNRLEGQALIAGTDIRVPSERNSQIAAR